MKVIRAEVLGFCFGVKRAVTAAEKSVEEKKDSKIYTLGPLIHNPEVLNQLETKGVKSIEPQNICGIEEKSTVIIRAHGTTPSVVKMLEEKNVEILDATCPRVHASQNCAEVWSLKGYKVFIAGDKNHGEVTGISGYSVSDVCVIQNEEEAEACSVPEKSILLAQTTFSPTLFEKIAGILKEKNPQLQVFNTICNATMDRQNALKKVAENAEGIIVIGGKSSANTKRLFETAASLCKNAVLIENAEQIPESFFELDTVALTAGASTPDYVIDSVEQSLKNH